MQEIVGQSTVERGYRRRLQNILNRVVERRPLCRIFIYPAVNMWEVALIEADIREVHHGASARSYLMSTMVKLGVETLIDFVGYFITLTRAHHESALLFFNFHVVSYGCPVKGFV